MKSIISANFNLLNQSSIWDKLKEKDQFTFDEYNNFNFTLNNDSIINKYNKCYLVIYVNEMLKEQKTIKNFFLLLNRVASKYISKKFYIFFLKEKLKNIYLDQSNLLKFNECFNSFKNKNSNLFFIDIPENKSKFNLRNYFYMRCPLEISTIKEIIKSINEINKEKDYKNYKLLILDCDNTLWGGVVGEDGVNKIKYNEDGDGKVFLEIQRHIKKIKEKGILLSLASKNNEKIVWETFKNRGMFLKKNDFVAPKVNWFEKSNNILSTLNELSLRSEDVLFIDDNLIELKKVKKSIPKINIYHVNDLIDFLKFLYKNNRLQLHKITEEDKKKSYQYKIRSKFETLKTKNFDRDIFSKLNQKIKILEISDKNINRASQLTNKVNQFNFTTNRYDISKILKLKRSKMDEIKLISFKDKFGDHGIVGLYNLSYKTKNSILITDFLLSCRIINRKIEDYILYKILNNNKNKNVVIHFIENKNNKSLINLFLKKSFFSLEKKIGKKKLYKIKSDKGLLNAKNFFK